MQWEKKKMKDKSRKFFKISTYGLDNRPYSIYVVAEDKNNAMIVAHRDKRYKNEDDNIDVFEVVEVSREKYENKEGEKVC